jgi:hypothetical protein
MDVPESHKANGIYNAVPTRRAARPVPIGSHSLRISGKRTTITAATMGMRRNEAKMGISSQGAI